MAKAAKITFWTLLAVGIVAIIFFLGGLSNANTVEEVEKSLAYPSILTFCLLSLYSGYILGQLSQDKK